MKLLITGGAGFIGSAVIRHVIQNTEDEVVNLDKLTYAGNLESLAEVNDNGRYTFEQVDICNRTEVDRVLKEHQPDAIMHLAAESHVDRSIDGPADFIETNIVGTYTLLEAARQYWQTLETDRRKNFRFHHISTDEVYGDLGSIPSPPAGEGQGERGAFHHYSQKKPPTIQAHHTRPAKPAQTISSAPGTGRMGCPYWSPTAPTTTAPTTFPRSSSHWSSSTHWKASPCLSTAKANKSATGCM